MHLQFPLTWPPTVPFSVELSECHFAEVGSIAQRSTQNSLCVCMFNYSPCKMCLYLVPYNKTVGHTTYVLLVLPRSLSFLCLASVCDQGGWWDQVVQQHAPFLPFAIPLDVYEDYSEIEINKFNYSTVITNQV